MQLYKTLCLVFLGTLFSPFLLFHECVSNTFSRHLVEGLIGKCYTHCIFQIDLILSFSIFLETF